MSKESKGTTVIEQPSSSSWLGGVVAGALASCVTDGSAREKLESLSQDSWAHEAEIRSPQVQIVASSRRPPRWVVADAWRACRLPVTVRALGVGVRRRDHQAPTVLDCVDHAASCGAQSRTKIAVVVWKLACRMARVVPRQGLASSFPDYGPGDLVPDPALPDLPATKRRHGPDPDGRCGLWRDAVIHRVPVRAHRAGHLISTVTPSSAKLCWCLAAGPPTTSC